MKKKLGIVFTSLVLLFAFAIGKVYAAGSATATYTGNSSVTVGSNITLNFNISNISGATNGKLVSFGGYIDFDSSYLQFVSATGLNGFTASLNTNNHKIALVDYALNGTSGGNIGSVTFKALKSGTTSVSVRTAEGTDTDKDLTINFSAKSITITEPVVKDNNSKLKSLSVDGYSISPSFSSGTTSYTVTVPAGTTSVKVNATADSSKASVSGTGTVSLSGDKTTKTIKCTAENGSSTSYTITINREKAADPTPTTPTTPTPTPTPTTTTKKNTNTTTTKEPAKAKSSDKNVDLKILSSHTITPAFTNNNNAYDVTVPYDVTKLDLSVIPYDKNASVKISGNEKLSSEENNVVKILVTAEDGSTRTITLNVTRSAYKANTDLLSLKVKDYKMSPKFKPSKTEYKVTVPYKVKKVTVIAKAPKGSKVKITGNKNLQVGKNVVLVKVTDKKGFVKYYQINVTRKRRFPFLIIFLILLILLLLLLLLRRKKKKEKRKLKAAQLKQKREDNDIFNQSSPVNIEFKPEFNFGSKNGTDDDVIYSKGDMINGTDVQKLPEQSEGKVIDADYDIYDDVVTKDEIVDALNESIRTKNVDKLQMLLDQENLNRKKEKIKSREEKEKLEENDYEPRHSKDDYDD